MSREAATEGEKAHYNICAYQTKDKTRFKKPAFGPEDWRTWNPFNVRAGAPHGSFTLHSWAKL